VDRRHRPGPGDRLRREQVDAEDVPTSVFELTEPEYKGQVAIAPTNASFQSFITAMRLAEGEDVDAPVARGHDRQ
jgi:ABC-type Fe3+ transport system substrate-binding protein